MSVSGYKPEQTLLHATVTLCGTTAREKENPLTTDCATSSQQLNTGTSSTLYSTCTIQWHFLFLLPPKRVSKNNGRKLKSNDHYKIFFMAML